MLLQHRHYSLLHCFASRTFNLLLKVSKNMCQATWRHSLSLHLAIFSFSSCIRQTGRLFNAEICTQLNGYGAIFPLQIWLGKQLWFFPIPAPKQLWRMVRNIRCARSVQNVPVQKALPLCAERSLTLWDENGIWNISTDFHQTLWP